VDLVLTGHVHLYARTCSVRHDRCVGPRDDRGITHITLGALRALCTLCGLPCGPAPSGKQVSLCSMQLVGAVEHGMLC
jgi:hypothetical protein